MTADFFARTAPQHGLTVGNPSIPNQITQLFNTLLCTANPRRILVAYTVARVGAPS